MSTSTLMTADELLRLPKDGYRYELIRGELHQRPRGSFETGVIKTKVSSHLLHYVKQPRIGMVLTSDPGFKLESNPDTVRAPDVAYLSKNRLRQITDLRGYVEFAPDLAIEVLSPNDSPYRLVRKSIMWLQAGTLAVVVVNPYHGTATLYQPGNLVTEFTDTDVLTVPTVVPGWAMPVREMFE